MRRLLLFPLLALAAHADALVSVQAPLVVNAGGSIQVGIQIDNVADLYGFQFDLTFDPTLVQAVDAAEGPFLPGGGSTFFEAGTIDNVGGSISSAGDSLLTAISGVSGSGLLGFVDFNSIAPGPVTFSLQNVFLLDSSGADIPFTTLDGGTLIVSTPEPSGFAAFASMAAAFALWKSRRWALRRI